jgi:FMN phosphatase YigB (HAD superfamily)
MLKAIIMDVDGTLYRQGPVQRRMAWRLVLFSLRNPLLGWRTVSALRAYRRAQESLRGATGQPDSALRQIDTAARTTGYTTEFIRRCVAQWMEDEPLSAVAKALYPGVTEFFVWAGRNDLRLAVVSDYDPRKKIRALGLDHHVLAAVWAQDVEVGVFKPDPRGLKVAMRRLGIEPSEAIYVGDRPEVDGTAALAAGIPAVLLTPRHSPPAGGVTTVGDWYALRELVESATSQHAVLSALSRQ